MSKHRAETAHVAPLGFTAEWPEPYEPRHRAEVEPDARFERERLTVWGDR
ncbi:hypothetical protein [Nocardioides sp.]|nr:hypothetical protein [Nocardioides sp.]HSX67047.1 hypothetical protein [Nocardioides sp.]